jgi:hypothetical protein
LVFQLRVTRHAKCRNAIQLHRCGQFSVQHYFFLPGQPAAKTLRPTAARYQTAKQQHDSWLAKGSHGSV